MEIDQREMGVAWEKQNPNFTKNFNKVGNNVQPISKNNYNYKNIKDLPVYREDVLCPNTEKLIFNHQMDALKYCNDNKIGFLWWNDVMYDLEGNILNIEYYDLPNKNKGVKNELHEKLLFVKSFEPYDFRRSMGQLAVKLTYTNTDTEMLTTKSTNGNVLGTITTRY